MFEIEEGKKFWYFSSSLNIKNSRIIEILFFFFDKNDGANETLNELSVSDLYLKFF